MPNLPTPGLETQVNTSVPASIGVVESIAHLSDGGYVITWAGGTATTYDVYAQRYTANGVKVGPEVLVNSTISDTQLESRAVALADGGFTIVWVGAGFVGEVNLPGIFSQRFDANGARVGGETRLVEGGLTATYVTTTQPTIAALADGGYVMAWTLHFNSGFLRDVVKVQSFDADGTPRGTAVDVDPSITAGQYWFPKLTALTGGGFVVSWVYNIDGNDVVMQRFDASGAPVGDKAVVNTTMTSQQDDPSITALSNGGYVVTWTSFEQIDNSTDIVMQRFDADGNPVGVETVVNTYTTAGQSNSNVVGLPDGSFIVVWNSRGQDGSGFGCYGQQFTAAGEKIGEEFLINTTTNGTQYEPLVAPLDGGGFVVTWYNAVGTAVSIQHKTYTVVLPIEGGDGNDSLNGTPGDDVMNGLAGDDTMKGGVGNDRIDGGTGADKMYGGLGNDTYVVESLADKIFESNNQGIDTVETGMSFALTGLYVENLTVSGTGNFAVGGNGFANVLVGNSGNNTINGGLNGDTMSGGAGNDLYFVDHVGDVVIELANEGKDAVNASITYTLTDNVETLALIGYQAINGTGNGLDNTVTGNGNANQLNGGDGKDLLIGQGGNDILTGGAGADSFRFYRAGALNGLDHLTDFVSGTDKLQLTGADYGFAKGQVLTAAQVHTGGSVGAFGQFLYNIVNHTLYWDADGTGATAAVALAVFDNSAQPVAGDFVFL